MKSEDETALKIWASPKPDAVGDTVEQFLETLGQPTIIHLPGKDVTRTRAVVTLLHGNEPSGIIALHRILKAGITPQVNLIFVVVSVKAALLEPGFFYRNLPGYRDLNRCFAPPYHGEEGQLAKDIIDYLMEQSPECVLDIHNTSGAGPAFSVATRDDNNHDALTRLFANLMIVTHIRLGAFMELSEYAFPTLTIECGGAQDLASHQIAYNGLLKYMTQETVLESPETAPPIELMVNPVRVELNPKATLAYGTEPQDDADLTLLPDVERHNFGEIEPGVSLGWLGSQGVDVLSAKDADGIEKIHELFGSFDGQLQPRKNLRLFMVTPRSSIARSDCLFYAIEI